MSVTAIATLACVAMFAAAAQSPVPPPTTQAPVSPAPAAAGQTAEAADAAGDVWLVIYSVLPERAADFESVARQVREALGKRTDPVRQAQGRDLRVHRSSLPNAEGRLMYFLQVPALAGEGDRSGLDVLIDAVLPAQATVLKQQLTASLDAKNPSGNTYLISVR